jgi:multicomponent Na+:H+ antiporter subunit E
MKIKTKSRLIVFVLGSLVWFALTDIKDIQEVITGIVIALLISLLAGHFLVVNQTSRGVLRRLLYLVIYIFRFLWELIKANLNVAYLVIHPKLPIKPGIVKIKTKLTKDSALTLLGNSITLTPGTMTVDINEDKKELYIHWIYVKEVQEEKATQEISQNFERILTEIFE